MKKVSIVVPIYNKAAYLEKCIKSILSQSYDEIEVLLIDDGSRDGSLEIIKKFAQLDNRAIPYHQENQGRSAARNAGIRISSGDYICFVDADDAIESDYVAHLLEAAEKTSADIAICEMSIKSETGKTRTANKLLSQTLTANHDFLYNYIAQSGGAYATSSCNKLFKMDFFKKYNLWFKRASIGEDFLLCIDAFSHEPIVTTIGETLYVYYQNISSTMHNYNTEYFENIYEFMKKLSDYGMQSNQEIIVQSCSCANVKNVFKIMSGRVYNEKRVLQKLRIIRCLCHDKAINEYINKCRPRMLAKNYQLVYILYSCKLTVPLYVLCEYYLRRSI